MNLMKQKTRIRLQRLKHFPQEKARVCTEKNANTLRMNNGSETDRIREREREKENMHNILLARMWLNYSSGSQL